MRPTRLEVSGFTAFREPTLVDLTGADLYAFVGPTGSGKTSLIEAMVFALYGSVPRLDDRRLVAPVISQGRNEARVRLDFLVGEESYTAVRVVRRTARGATTKEARLERGDEVLAADADELSRAVEQLIGLSFDQFTTCVVLPQGEFARFLHDKPSQRQDLLVRLLGLDVYRRLGRAANNRASLAGQRADLAAEQLGRLAGATPQRLEELDAAVARCEALVERISAAQPDLDRLREEAERASAAETTAAAEAEALAALTVPALVDALADERAGHESARQRATEAHEAAADRVAELEQQLADHGDPATARRAVDAWERLEALVSSRAELAAARDQAGAAAAAASADLALGEAQLEAAAAAVAQARDDHAAAALRRGLAPGAACPVCAQAVDTLPPPLLAADLHAAEQAATRARAAVDRARGVAAGAERQLAEAQARLEATDEELERQRTAVAAGPSAAAAARTLEAIEQAQQALAIARAQQQRAAGRLRQAQQRVAALAEREAHAWRDYHAARDPLAALGPPAPAGEDLARSWAALAAWARATVPGRRDAAAEAARRSAEATAARRALVEEIIAALAAAGLEPAGRHPLAVASAAAAAARAERQQIADALDTAAQLGEVVQAARAEATVAHELGQHLAANRFEKWLLAEAFRGLAADASRLLHALSQGQYSLAFDDSYAFRVVDHANADETRAVRTLSGGETFLASLALALALAEQIGSLSAHGAHRLESLFLDEGFGTLDPEALEIVAAAIEELGASGRTVGVVTHVRDLAERVPVRFEVRRTPATAIVTRIDQ